MKGMIHVLIGAQRTGKTLYAEYYGALERDHTGDLGELAVHLVGRLGDDRVNGEEYTQHAVSMHNYDSEAVNLVMSIAQYYARPVRVLEITEHGVRE